MGIKKLIQKCQKGNFKAQKELYQLFAPQLFAVSLKYSKDYHEAEDNLQEAFLSIYTKINQYNFKGSFEGWLKRITINTALQSYRKQQVFDLIDESTLLQPEEVDVDEEDLSLDFLFQCLQELPSQYRLVFTLYVLDEYSHTEIAEALQISEGTSKSNLARARKLLKEKIESAISSAHFKNHRK